jgi:histidyl-tRNA synthetase
MLLAAAAQPTPVDGVDLFVAFAKPHYRREAMRIANEVRQAGLHAQLELAGRSLKGQLKQADRIGARYVAILGDEGAQLKDMESGEQHEVEVGALPAAVLRQRPGG